MDWLRKGSTLRTPLTLGAVLLSGCLAGLLGAMAGPSEFAPDPSGSAAAATAGGRCSYCGVVEHVREIENTGPKYGVSTVSGGRDEVIVMLLGALSGMNVTSRRPKIYEVTVRMDNGSIRAERGVRVPRWKVGDRVKFVKGQVERMS